MADFVPQQRKKTALDNRKLTINTPCPSAPGKYSGLVWGFYSNNPRITVYTNDPNDNKDFGKINANLDMPVFYTFLDMLQKVIDGPVDSKVKLENKNYIFPQGKRSEKPVIVSELWFGKDKDGIIWLSVVAKDRPKIKFPFTHSDFHTFIYGDGTPVPAAEVSKAVAEGYVSILRQMMVAMAVDNFVEPVKKDGGNRGGNGGGSYGGGNSGGQSTGNFGGADDDIPF